MVFGSLHLFVTLLLLFAPYKSADATYTTLRFGLIMTFAAGVGGAMAAMQRFLQRAVTRRDFRPSEAGWYLGQPFIGLLAGFVFFTVFGRLIKLPASIADAPDALTKGLAYAALGALVGLASKEAVDKLNEIFRNTFQTKDSTIRQFYDSLPPGLQSELRPHLSEAIATTLGDGNVVDLKRFEDLQTELAKLTVAGTQLSNKKKEADESLEGALAQARNAQFGSARTHLLNLRIVCDTAGCEEPEASKVKAFRRSVTSLVDAIDALTD